MIGTKPEKLKLMIDKLDKKISELREEINDLEGLKIQAQVYLTIWESGFTPEHQGSDKSDS